MSNITSITLSASGNVVSQGTFSTLDNSFGTAGTSNANVASVQGISGGVAVTVTGSITTTGTTIVSVVNGITSVAVSGTTNVSVVNGITTVAVSGTAAVSVVNGITTVALSGTSAVTVVNGITSVAVSGTSNVSVVNTVPVTGTFFPTLQLVGSSIETSTVYEGTTALTASTTIISASASGANTTVSGVSGKSIRVLSLQLTASTANNIKWQSASGPTDLTGLAYFATSGGYVLPLNQLGWFQSKTGEGLAINLAAAGAVGGSLNYVTA